MALSFLSLLGCGTTNHLQTITLTAGNASGTFNIQGIGGTLQLKATGNYSSQQTKDLTNVVTYTITADPGSGGVLPTPPQGVMINITGMITAVDPAVCTWLNVEPDPAKPPAWVLTGDYKVVATFQGVISQPVFVGVASAAGPTGPCGP
jgi:hypothetical protein